MKDLSLHVLDIAQNSISAGAKRIVISLRVSGVPPELEFEMTDDGRGMEPEFLKIVTDPFTTSRTTRQVGLGIPLLRQSAEIADGELIIESVTGKGTTIRATFKRDHIDRIPIGDIAGTLVLLISANPEIIWVVQLKSHKEEYLLDMEEVAGVLDGVSIQNSEVLLWIQNTLQESVNLVFGGVLDEVT